jgi:hypothetical protein
MTDYSPLQIALLALLPKSGEGVKVAALAEAAGITQQQVTSALIGPYMSFACDFDITTDCYSAIKTGNALPHRLPLRPTNHQ